MVLSISVIILPVFADNSISGNGQLQVKSLSETTRFTNIVLFQNGFEISDYGRADISVYLKAQNVDKVKLYVQLQQLKNGKWKTIKSWSKTSNGTYAGLGAAYYVTQGYQYRLVSKGKVYLNQNLVEQTTYTSSSETY